MHSKCEITRKFSAVVLGCGILYFTVATFHWLATWRQIYMIEAPCIKVENYLFPIGLYTLGLELLGYGSVYFLYRGRNRIAWLMLLVITIVLGLPLDIYELLLRLHYTPMRIEDLWRGVRAGWGPSISTLSSLVTGIFMILAILIAGPCVFKNDCHD